MFLYESVIKEFDNKEDKQANSSLKTYFLLVKIFEKK